MKTVADFAKQAMTFATTLPDVEGKGEQKAALHVTKSIRAELKEVVPDGRLSGTKKNAKLSVNYKTRPAGGVLIKANGPWPLIESDTPAHEIPNEAKAGRKQRGRSAFKARKTLNIPGIGFRTTVSHPGTKGQKPFGKGVDKSANDVPKIIRDTVVAEMVRVFK